MKRVLLILLLMLLPALGNLKAQTFNVAGISADGFPEIKASVFTLDASGQSYKNLSKNDFTIIQDGVTLPTSAYELTCSDPPISVVIVVDQSTSMWGEGQVYDNSKWVWAKEGVSSFLSNLRLADSSAVLLTTFSKYSTKRSPYWLDNKVSYKKIVMDSLDNLFLYPGGTNFNAAFLGDPLNPPDEIGDDCPITLLAARPLNQRRVIVFLTDGKHDNGYHGPVKINEIISKLKANNIQCYGITLVDTVNVDLANISTESGGKYYRVTTKSELANIYSLIAADINYKILCDLTWQGNMACDDISSYHDVQITFNRSKQTVARTYKTPASSISKLETDKPVLEFSNIDPGNSEVQPLVITARRADFYLSDITLTPNTYFEVVDWGNGSATKPTSPVKFTQDVPQTIKIKFNQQSPKQFRKSTMTLIASPCNMEIPIVAGLSQITLIKPIGGTVYSTCDTVQIFWSGVDKNTRVNLSYSTDGGNSWKILQNDVTGGSYNWMPPGDGNQYKIKASVSATYYYMWADNIGGTGADRGTSVAAMDNEGYVYTGGYFSGTANWGTTSVTSKGVTDSFVAKYDKDGNLIWVETAGSALSDSCSGVAVASNGDVYTVGTMYMGISFASQLISSGISGLPYIYVAKYAKTGGAPTVRYFGARDVYTTFQAWGNSIYVDEAAGIVYVRGGYKGKVADVAWQASLNKATNSNMTLQLTTSMAPISVTDGWTTSMNALFSKATDSDVDGNTFYTGSYTGSKTFGSYTVNSKGGSDGYLAKYGGEPGSADETGVFSVESPKLRLKVATHDFGSSSIGGTKTDSLKAVLENYGSLPIEITNVTITTSTAGEFATHDNYVGTVVPAGGSIELVLDFIPTEVGLRTGTLMITGSCGVTASMGLTGNGTCDATTAPVDFTQVSIGQKAETILNCIFYNSNDQPVEIDPVVVGANASMFTILDTTTLADPIKTLVAPKTCYPLKVIYKPLTPGNHIARIDFKMPAVCNPAYALLTGSAINNDLKVVGYDFGARRVKGDYQAEIQLINNATLAINLPVSEFKFTSQPADDAFTFELAGVSGPNIVVPASSTLRMKVHFKPVNEVSYSSNIQLKMDGVDQTLTIPLTGSGFLPKIDLAWDCDNPAEPGKTSVATLTISNPSKSSELKVGTIAMTSAMPQLTAVNAADLNGFTVPKEGSVPVLFTFAPTVGGSYKTKFNINNDAYDGTYTNQWITNSVDGGCNALDATATTSLDFGQILYCSKLQSLASVTNNGGDSVLTIFKNASSITGADAAFFSLNLPGDVNIASGATTGIPVLFSPTEPREYNAVLNLANSFGADLKVVLKGSVATFGFSVANANYDVTPGKDLSFTLKGQIAALGTGAVSGMSVIAKYDPHLLSIDYSTVASGVSGLTWTAAELPGRAGSIFTTSNPLPTPFDGDLIKWKFQSFLGDVQLSKFEVAMAYECDTNFIDLANFHLADICVLDTRLVNISDKDFVLKSIAPNPVGSQFVLNYSVAFDCETRIDIVNSIGEVVAVVLDGVCKKGDYQETLKTGELSSGVYTIRMHSGPYSSTKPLIIAK